MISKLFRIIIYIFIINFFTFNYSFSDSNKQIEITGNKRISNETIIMFAEIQNNDLSDPSVLNKILKNLYKTNYFENVSIKYNDSILYIKVEEYPLIKNIEYTGIKAKKIENEIKKDLNLKNRLSFNKFLLKKDIDIIKKKLRLFGYFFSSVDVYLEELDDNLVSIKYQINLGEKAKIKKISFIGDKVFKDKKLKSIIISEESKFWKFISGKKFLNENVIALDTRLLKNFYLNKGYYNVQINTSYAKSIDNKSFELIFSIDANERIFFNDLTLNLPIDYDKDNFKELFKLFENLKGEPYSINIVEDILDKIDQITLNNQFESISASINEEIVDEKLNLNFKIEETEKLIVEKINIFGNNVTRENVIRNQFEIDEGDPYNEILAKKSINNLKSLNFFKDVKSETTLGSKKDTRVINISIEEKPTGEISAGAGVGTSGSTISFGIRENNYLGKGVSVSSNIILNEESVKGLLSVTNPNYNNSDKLVYFTAEASETDRLETFGYKTTRNGFALGSNFEFLDQLRFGLGNSNYYEKIETSSIASERQKKQKGNYWDSFLNLEFDYDTRNQKFQATDGIRSQYFVDIPLISETASFTNTYLLKSFKELYEDNISSISLFLQSSFSIKDENIKLSERIILPSSRLRGFERGKIGPKDGKDYIGGNYAAAVNFSSTIPQILSNEENIDFLFFIDAANVWGVDYFDGEDEGSEIRSSTGFGIDWLTPVGPLKFTLATPITKADTDKTETFRFDLGTTF